MDTDCNRFTSSSAEIKSYALQFTLYLPLEEVYQLRGLANQESQQSAYE